MTAIILTIIGKLVASASMLMVIHYGGDAFSGGDIRACAAMFRNAGLNVISAVRLYRAETGRPIPTIAQLISDGYLIEDPDTPRPQTTICSRTSALSKAWSITPRRLRA